MPAGDAAAVRLEACSVQFGAVAAVRGVDLTVAKGEALALLGPSGCGKTTLLRAISGAVEASGHREVNGRTGIVYQDLKLLPWKSVAGNVALSRRTCSPSDHDELRQLLSLAAIDSKIDTYPYLLSGGQRQRVAIVRALFAGAEILLLDEPFSALDFIARQRLLDVIRAVRSSRRVTLIMVTHNIEDAIELADRLLVMREGSVAGEFDRRELRDGGSTALRTRILDLYRGGTK